jgi:hypothetical protein
MPTAFRAPSAAFLACGVACQPSGTLDGIGHASQAEVFHRILGSNTVRREGPWIRTFFSLPGLNYHSLFGSTNFSLSMLEFYAQNCHKLVQNLRNLRAFELSGASKEAVRRAI